MTKKVFSSQLFTSQKAIKLATVLGLLTTLPCLAQEVKLPRGKIQLGTLNQGENKQVKVPIYNNTAHELRVDMVIPQGIGPKNVKHPQSISPKQTGYLDFNYQTAYVKGQVQEHISVVFKDNITLSIPIEGMVKSQIFFNEQVVDFGFIGNQPVERQVYIWGENPEKFEIKAKANKFAQVKLKKVFVDPTDPEKPVEVKSTHPKAYVAYIAKISVSSKKLTKSLSTLLEFESSTYLGATPEIHLVGYKK